MLVEIRVVLERFIGGLGIRQINEGGIRFLDCAGGKGLCLMNTCFQKRKSRLITFRLGETETMIDYILVNNKYSSSVKDVKKKEGQEERNWSCGGWESQGWKKSLLKGLATNVMVMKIVVVWKESCWMLWVKSVVIIKTNPGILKRGSGIKMWVWLCVERELFRVWKQSQNEEDRKKKCEAKKDAKRVVYVAIDQEAQEVVRKLIHVMMVLSCLEFPKIGLGWRTMLLGLVVLKMKVGWWK